MYAVILAGGGGTRLWPLSTPERPKPFLPLLGPRSLLQRTAERLAGLSAPRATSTWSRTPRYGALVRAQLPAATVLAEPTGRNTAAAIALAALRGRAGRDDVMVVLPADHLIPARTEGLPRRPARRPSSSSRRTSSASRTPS